MVLRGCGFEYLVYWFTQQYSELQPPGGCGGAVTINDIECGLSGIGCGGGGGTGCPCIGKLQMIICGDHIGGIPGCHQGGGVSPQQCPGGGSIGITDCASAGITASASVTSPIAGPIPSLFLIRVWLLDWG